MELVSWLQLFVAIVLPYIYRAEVPLEELRERLKCQQTTGIDGSKNSFLWSIKRDPPAYFFGTIHVPYSRVWDYIPENTKIAYHQSNNIVFELDLTDPYTISALTNCQMLPNGENLSDVLPQSLYERLKRHLEYVKLMMPTWMTADQRGRGMYADYLFNAIAGNWERKRPVWVMLMLNSLSESDIKSRGVPVLDLFLAQEAERMNKRTAAVERVEEQCVPLNGLNFTQVLFALNQSLFQQEILRTGERGTSYTTEDLIRHYNCGDLNSVIFNKDTSQVSNLINSSLDTPELNTARDIDMYFRHELIYKRNHRMASRVRDLLEEFPQKSFFFAFGAGHFLGNNSVIDTLQNEGYEIEHVLPDQDIRKIKRRRDKERKKRKRKRKKEESQEEKEPRRQFKDLWVRIDNISPEPSTAPTVNELEPPVTVATTPYLSQSIYFIYMPNSNNCYRCNLSWLALLCSLLLCILLCKCTL